MQQYMIVAKLRTSLVPHLDPDMFPPYSLLFAKFISCGQLRGMYVLRGYVPFTSAGGN